MPTRPRTSRTPAKRDRTQPDSTMLVLFEQLKVDFESGLPVELPGCGPAPGGVNIYRAVDQCTSEGRHKSVRLLHCEDEDGRPVHRVVESSGKSTSGSSKVSSRPVDKRRQLFGSDDDEENTLVASSSSSSSSGPGPSTPHRRVGKHASSSSSRSARGTPSPSPSKARRGTRRKSRAPQSERGSDSDQDLPRRRRA
ncbi:hypothetical protein JCM8208_006211 [Rhodotorula glutinis]